MSISTTMRRLLCLGALLWVLSAASAALSLTPQAVYVVPAGGTESALIYDLDTSQTPPRVVQLGSRRLVPEAWGPVAVTDLKVLPDGDALIAGASGRGAALTSAAGVVDFTLGAPGDYPSLSTASVALYAGRSQPTVLLIADTDQSMLRLHDVVADATLWEQDFQLGGARSFFVQAAVLPESRIAVAINWRSLGESAIEILSPGNPGAADVRLSSVDSATNPGQTPVIEALATLRDMMALPNGHLLVASRDHLLEVGLDGTVHWSVDVANADAIAGEVAAARLLESGDVALATYETGVWTRPHPNHQVYWLDRSALEDDRIEIIARTGPLDQAPLRVEPVAGHGGSGTFGYHPGVDDAAAGDLDGVELQWALRFDPDRVVPGGSLTASTRIIGSSQEAVILQSAAIVAVPGECDSAQQTPRTLVSRRRVQVSATQAFDLWGDVAIDGSWELGRWCARVVLESTSGDRAFVGEAAYFEVGTTTASDAGASVAVRDVGWWAGDAGPDTGVGQRDRAERGPGGCQCDTADGGRGPASAALGVMLALVGGAAWRRRAR